jgi:TetR/AcrR family transcriptional regulator, cholesterol catabolism regulator
MSEPASHSARKLRNGAKAAGPRVRKAPPPAEALGENTRERIVRAAIALFYERGYRGTSVAAIASTLKISAPALYWHFPSKREICFAAVYEELRKFEHALAPCQWERTPELKLSRFVRTYVLLKLQQNKWLREPGAVGAYRQLRQALSAKQRERLDALQRGVLAMLRTILSEGASAGAFRFDDLTATAFAIVTLCEYVFAWVRTPGRLGPGEIADLYRGLVLAMVGAVCGAPASPGQSDLVV